jgi:hypothetical protein
MAEGKNIFDLKFWKVLKFIDKMIEPTPLLLVLQETDVDREQFHDVLHFLSNFNYKIEMTRVDGIEVVIPPDSKYRVKFDLSFSEWLALQAHFPKMDECNEEAYHNLLAEKMAAVERSHPQFDLFKVLEDEKKKHAIMHNIEDSEYSEIAALLEKALIKKEMISLSLKDKHFFDFYPHRLVFLDGGLSIVGEECNDRCLAYFQVEDLKEAILEEGEYKPNFSGVEVNDFIFAIRAVSGKEERLILKITSAESIDLKPPYHFLGNPYITSSLEGDLIWAASVEISEDLFEWLYEVRHHIEILDPSNLESEYYRYCEERRKKVA